MHTVQHKEFNRLKEEVRRDLLQGLPLYLRTLLLVVDMGQNTATPYLGGNQFGDFNYMTPITHLIFGNSSPAEEFTNT